MKTMISSGKVRSKRLSRDLVQKRGMVNGLCELLWIKYVRKDLGIQCSEHMNLLCDNKAAIQIAQNPVQHICTALRGSVETRTIMLFMLRDQAS